MNIMYSIVSAMTYISNIYFLLRQIRSSIPPPVLNFLESTIPPFLKLSSNKITIMIEENNGISRDELYEAADLYLPDKISPNADLLKVAKYPRENHFTIKFKAGGKVIDSYQGIKLEWEYCDALDKNGGGSRSFNSSTSSGPQTRHFKLRFDKEYRQRIIDSYFPHVIAKSKAIRDCRKSLKLCMLGSGSYGPRFIWDPINFDHPSTFDTLAMDPEMKKDIKDDLDRFVRRRDFYRRVGRAWKRGYLLYGPPGTGKSSLIAAIANYLKFDVYDLQLGNLMGDSDFRRVLLATANRSILAIEDIDCSVKIPGRSGMRSYHGSNKISNHSNDSDDSNRSPEVQARMQLTLSGLLNFIDGLWSSCGDERIIIFTTNHKERLDPALLRPGRMDKHIHMSYLTAPGFRTLASNYLDLKGQPEHRLFRDIERLIEMTNVSPAQVAEELMRSEDVDIALEGVVRLLERKKMEDKEAKIEDDADGCIASV